MDQDAQSHRPTPVPRERPAGLSRKRQHAAFMLPVVGLLLIIPPLLTLFGVHRFVFGAPLQAVYLLAVWLALIGAALLFARCLPTAGTDAHGDGSQGEP